MNFRGMNDFRDKRNQFHNMPYQMHYSIASYCTDSSKEEMKATFGDEFLNNLPMIPDPLRKNLADTLITAEVSNKAKSKSFLEENRGAKVTMDDSKLESNCVPSESHTFSGITSFISGVFNVLTGAMFRSKPEDHHYDFNYTDDQQRSPDDWQSPKIVDQNINERAHEQNGEKEIQKTMEMNNDYHSTITSCEAKLNQVRNLLNTKPVQNVKRFRPKRPKKQFVDIGAYEEVFEDAFTSEFITNLADDQLVEFICPSTYQSSECLEIDGPLTRSYNGPSKESSTKVEESCNQCDKQQLDTKILKNDTITEKSSNLISSCEEKLRKLKALTQKKFTTPSNFISEPESKMAVSEPRHSQKATASPKIHDKHYKNHHRTTNKRQKANLQRSIQEDLLFANEIDPDNWSNVENFPPITAEVPISADTPPSDQTNYFDEVKGRFRNSSTTESDDSFQIVFTEPTRTRKVSECDSEDSFIVFDDSPESCYVSTDVFGENPSEIDTDYSDSDSNMSDSGCGVTDLRCNKLSPYLSRTISDLTDDSLYDEPLRDMDQVDCAFKTAVELPSKAVVEPEVVEKKKCKKVHFSPLPPKVHVMRVWAFAARQARAGHWERLTLDRERFKRRIADVEMAVSWVLKPQHRSRVVFQRFMPWWNAQRRKEIADKQERDRQAKIEEDEKEEERQAQIEEDAKNREENEKEERERQHAQIEGAINREGNEKQDEDKQERERKEAQIDDGISKIEDGKEEESIQEEKDLEGKVRLETGESDSRVNDLKGTVKGKEINNVNDNIHHKQAVVNDNKNINELLTIDSHLKSVVINNSNESVDSAQIDKVSPNHINENATDCHHINLTQKTTETNVTINQLPDKDINKIDNKTVIKEICDKLNDLSLSA